MKRRILIVLLILVAVPLAGAGWQRLATAKDNRRYPAPGELVAVDDQGARLHLHTQGRHHRDANPEAPVVVLDAGTPGFSAQWGWIQPAIAEFATVVSYDRPGLGWSDPHPDGTPNAPRATAERLHAALQEVGLPGPYLLVGHSYGGLTTRVFAATYPAQISGLVLVDPSHPDQGGDEGMGNAARSMALMAALAHTGALRLGLAIGLFDDRIGALPEQQVNEASAILVRPGQWSTVQQELGAWSEIAVAARECRTVRRPSGNRHLRRNSKWRRVARTSPGTRRPVQPWQPQDGTGGEPPFAADRSRALASHGRCRPYNPRRFVVGTARRSDLYAQ